jgi:hypothetical protein
MIHDYTAAVIRLEQSYQSMQLARKRVADEVKMEYRALMRDEIARRQKAAEAQFAGDLAIEHAAGLPGNVIREHVLHTHDWSRWTKWRDLAGIDPDRVTVLDAKKAAQLENATFLWSDDYATLTVKKNSRGKTLSPELVYDMATNTKVRGGLWWPDSQDQDYDIRVMKEDEDFQFRKMVSAEIQRAIDAGEIDNPEEKG